MMMMRGGPVQPTPTTNSNGDNYPDHDGYTPVPTPSVGVPTPPAATLPVTGPDPAVTSVGVGLVMLGVAILRFGVRRPTGYPPRHAA